MTFDNILNIIVLLILAGVTISALSGENGLLKRAAEAKERNKEERIAEQRKLTIMEANMNIEETTYNSVKIPAGMAVSQVEGENTLEKGLVAIDTKGNEWVWIEVPKSIYTNVTYTAANSNNSVTSSTDYTGIYNILNKYAESYRKGKVGQNCNWPDEWYDKYGTTYDGTNEYSQVKYITDSDKYNAAKAYYGKIYTDQGTTEATSYASETTYYVRITEKITDTRGCGLTYDQYQKTYKKMLSSVYTNGGFWIGRYEAGVSNTTPRTLGK